MHHYLEVDAEKVSPEVRREVDRMRWYVAEDLGVHPRVRYFEPASELTVRMGKVINRLSLSLHRLGIDDVPPVQLAISDSRERGLLGFYSETIPEFVWIDATRPAEEAASTVAHEMRHAWQHVREWFGSMDRDGLEADAKAYEEKALAEYNAWCDQRLAEAESKHGTNLKAVTAAAILRLLPIVEKLAREARP